MDNKEVIVDFLAAAVDNRSDTCEMCRGMQRTADRNRKQDPKPALLWRLGRRIYSVTKVKRDAHLAAQLFRQASLSLSVVLNFVPFLGKLSANSPSVLA